VRGSVDYQITRIFNESGIFRPGTSRHKEKDLARAELAAEGIVASSEALADATGLHSYAYARDCKDTWHRLGRFAKEALAVKDMTLLHGGHVEQYLLRRTRDGISYDTWKKEAAHIGKLENALREWTAGNTDAEFIAPGIRMAALDPELRTLARERLRHGGKDFGHFDNPEAVIARMESDSQTEHTLIARIQLEGALAAGKPAGLWKSSCSVWSAMHSPAVWRDKSISRTPRAASRAPYRSARTCMRSWKKHSPFRAAFCRFPWARMPGPSVWRRDPPGNGWEARTPSATALPAGAIKS
jgi:hypothetical protein